MSTIVPDCTILYATENRYYNFVGLGGQTTSPDGWGKCRFILESEVDRWAKAYELGEYGFPEVEPDATFSDLALETLHNGQKFFFRAANLIAPHYWTSSVMCINQLVSLLDAESLWDKLPRRGMDGGSQLVRLVTVARDMVVGYYAIKDAWSNSPDAGGMDMILSSVVGTMLWEELKDVVPQEIADLRARVESGTRILWAI